MKFNLRKGGCIIIFLVVLLLVLPFASAKVVSPRSFWSQYSIINGVAIPIGSTVTAYDPDEVLCGSFTVTVQGGYGFLDCQGDDPDTPGVDEGAESGDTIAFYINGDATTTVGDTTWTEGGTAEVNLTSTNSKPSISGILGLSGTVKGNSSQTVTATATDSDHVKSATKDNLSLIICSTNSASDDTGCDATTYCNGTLVSSFSPTCTFNVILDDAAHNYYAFVMDEHSAVSLSSQSGSYTSDSTAPNITAVDPVNNSWVNTVTKEVTVTTDEDAACRYNTTNRTVYSSKTAMTGTGTSHTATLTLSNENSTNPFYFQCNDTAGNLMNLSSEYYYNLRRDTYAPNASLAAVIIESGDSYSTNTTLDFTWSGFNDSVLSTDVSGIEGYYYNFTNNEGTTSGTWDTSSSGILYNAAQGLITIYIWAKDNAGNIGLAVNDSILVDSEAPVYSNWQNNEITQDSTVNLTVNVTIADATSSLLGLPQLRYKYGSDAWSNYANMTLISGDKYNYTIPIHGGGWIAYKGENVSWQVNASDNLSNMAVSDTQQELIDSINHAPVLGAIQNYSVNEDSLLEFNITAADSDAEDVLTYTSNESNITITKINNTLATVSWTANNSYVGNNSITFIVTDDGAGTKSDNQTIIIEVINVNDAPYFEPALVNLTAYEDTAFSYDINATDIDPTNDVLNFSSNSTIFTINSTTGIISFTPTTADIGVYDINISVSDNNNATTSEVIQFSVLDKYNNITFYVRDRILQTELNNVTVVGNGTNCNAPGCIFNFTTSIREENANLQFIFTKGGFAQNTTNINLNADIEVNVTLDDNEQPVIHLTNVTGRADGSQYYIDVLANVTDNLRLKNVTLNYDFINGSFLNSTAIFTNRSDGFFNLTLGPFTDSKKFYSETYAEDYYGNNATSTNINWWFIFVEGQLNVTLPPLILTKNINYTNQTNRTVTYYVDVTVWNTRTTNITNTQYSETEAGHEVVNQQININAESTYTANYTVVINKQVNNHEHIFGLASVTYNGTPYIANRPDVLIPGYGLGPFDIEVLAIADQNTNANFDASITLENTNDERGGDFVINWWIKDSNGDTVSSGTKTVLVLAGQTVTTTIDATAPSSAGTYTFMVQVEADLDATSERSFNVIAAAEEDTGGGGGGGATVTTPVPEEEVTEVVEEPEVVEEIEEVEEKIPKQLLDIRMELEDNILEYSGELIAGVTFNNFGTEPTTVDLTYIILDESENEVYRGEGSVIVETEQFVSRSFKELRLPSGEYTFVLRTSYGEDIKDEFHEEFVIKAEKKALFEMPSPIKCKPDLRWWIVLIIILSALLIYEFLKMDKPYVVSEKKRAKLNIRLTLGVLALTAIAWFVNMFYCLPEFIFYIFYGLTLINIIVVLSHDKIRKKKHVSTKQEVIKHLREWKPKTKYDVKEILQLISKPFEIILIIVIIFGVLYAVYKLILKIITVLSNITTSPVQEAPMSLNTLLLAAILAGIIILIIIAAVILVFVIKIYGQNKQKSFVPINSSKKREYKTYVNKQLKKLEKDEKAVKTLYEDDLITSRQYKSKKKGIKEDEAEFKGHLKLISKHQSKMNDELNYKGGDYAKLKEETIIFQNNLFKLHKQKKGIREKRKEIEENKSVMLNNKQDIINRLMDIKDTKSILIEKYNKIGIDSSGALKELYRKLSSEKLNLKSKEEEIKRISMSDLNYSTIEEKLAKEIQEQVELHRKNVGILKGMEKAVHELEQKQTAYQGEKGMPAPDNRVGVVSNAPPTEQIILNKKGTTLLEDSTNLQKVFSNLRVPDTKKKEMLVPEMLEKEENKAKESIEKGIKIKEKEESIEDDIERLKKYGFKIKEYVEEPKITISKKTEEITPQKVKDLIQKQAATPKIVGIQKPVIVQKPQLKIELPKRKLRIKKIKSKKVDLGLIQSIYLNELKSKEDISKNFEPVKKEIISDKLGIKEKMLKQLNEVYKKEAPKWEKQ